MLGDPWLAGLLLDDLEGQGLNGHQLAVKCDHQPVVLDFQSCETSGGQGKQADNH